jgi:hypothetical protein
MIRQHHATLPPPCGIRSPPDADVLDQINVINQQPLGVENQRIGRFGKDRGPLPLRANEILGLRQRVGTGLAAGDHWLCRHPEVGAHSGPGCAKRLDLLAGDLTKLLHLTAQRLAIRGSWYVLRAARSH